jgi:hypothetical protein
MFIDPSKINILFPPELANYNICEFNIDELIHNSWEFIMEELIKQNYDINEPCDILIPSIYDSVKERINYLESIRKPPVGKNNEHRKLYKARQKLKKKLQNQSTDN